MIGVGIWELLKCLIHLLWLIILVRIIPVKIVLLALIFWKWRSQRHSFLQIIVFLSISIKTFLFLSNKLFFKSFLCFFLFIVGCIFFNFFDFEIFLDLFLLLSYLIFSINGLLSFLSYHFCQQIFLKKFLILFFLLVSS